MQCGDFQCKKVGRKGIFMADLSKKELLTEVYEMARRIHGWDLSAMNRAHLEMPMSITVAASTQVNRSMRSEESAPAYSERTYGL